MNDQKLLEAKDPNTPPKRLAQLAKDSEAKVRVVVAENPNTPPEVLMMLSQDAEVWVRNEALRRITPML
jgi:Leucine rich repeat variant